MPRHRVRVLPALVRTSSILAELELHHCYFIHHHRFDLSYAPHSIILLSTLAICPTAYALPVANGSNGLKIQLYSPWLRSHRLLNTLNQTILSIGLSSSSPWPNTASHRVTCRQALLSTPQRSSALPPVFFDPQQNRLILRRSPAPPSAPLSAPPTASPPAHKPCAPAPSELPPQLICPRIPTRPNPPSPSVETIEEVEQKQVYKPLRNIRKQTIDKKHGASIKMPRSQLPSFENYIEGPPISGGINMRFSRDEEPDA